MGRDSTTGLVISSYSIKRLKSLVKITGIVSDSTDVADSMHHIDVVGM